MMAMGGLSPACTVDRSCLSLSKVHVGQGTTAIPAASRPGRMPRATATPVASSPCTHSVSHLDLDALAGQGARSPITHHTQRLLARQLRILENGARDGARGEVAHRPVAPVGKAFHCQRQGRASRAAFCMAEP